MDLITFAIKHLLCIFFIFSADGEGFLEAAQGVSMVTFKCLRLSCPLFISFLNVGLRSCLFGIQSQEGRQGEQAWQGWEQVLEEHRPWVQDPQGSH